MRERGRGDDGGIFNTHTVVHFITFLQAAQNRDGIFDVRFANVDGLEAALKGSIFLDVLAIFVQGGGADGAKFSAGEGGLQHVGGVNSALRGASADQRVQFVDEQDDLSLGIFNLFENGLKSVFEFAAVFCPSEHRTEIKCDDALVLKTLGHVAGNDTLCEPFDDGGLAYSGFADKHWIVFGAAGKHLDDPTDLFVATNHRIELSPAS